ncbi:putative transporter [Zancudomyces culisetae]|uniref:Putative transporter n=1 Tax=Zancudomyces culisetae TaxID=1213189 RepID=A0A1R1PM33_ZANCU|nr:putative transporter [Zancudomyces culisetae]|eukprot:OMH82030.1 putative transporter [Zancudomyces culisetae]
MVKEEVFVYDDEDKAVINTEVILTDTEQKMAKSITRRLDIRLMPVLMLLYVGSYMDRSNIGAALVNGLRADLKLTKAEEALVTASFYIFYTTLELPANVILKKFRPRYWFSLIAGLWSVACMLQALAKSGGLIIMFRSILGAVESGFTPGVFAYLPYWYTRDEVGARMSLFFGALPISVLIGSPLAAGLASVKGTLEPYQMIFIVEGAVTFMIAVLSFFILQDYPETCKFLSYDQRKLLVKRLRADQGLATKSKLTLKSTIRAIFDWKVLLFCAANFGCITGINTVSIFGPTLMKGLGYSSVRATYLATLPGALGVVGIIITLFIPKRIPLTTQFFVFQTISVVFYTILTFSKNGTLRLISFALSGLGIYPSFPIFLSWVSVNQGGIGKRLMVSAAIFTIGNVTGAVIPVMFTATYAPHYYLGNAATIGLLGLSILLTAVMVVHYAKVNKQKEQNPIDVSHLSEEEQILLYDDHPAFRYTL